ncbi:hypothetical protein K438DRAFT_252399 [Mycena galopus ATCC 62051]|nr:hypothetical protein K438DRAFT_252399 [Mycena galopus ATCC 62051]
MPCLRWDTRRRSAVILILTSSHSTNATRALNVHVSAMPVTTLRSDSHTAHWTLPISTGGGAPTQLYAPDTRDGPAPSIVRCARDLSHRYSQSCARTTSTSFERTRMLTRSDQSQHLATWHLCASQLIPTQRAPLVRTNLARLVRDDSPPSP